MPFIQHKLWYTLHQTHDWDRGATACDFEATTLFARRHSLPCQTKGVVMTFWGSSFPWTHAGVQDGADDRQSFRGALQ